MANKLNIDFESEEYVNLMYECVEDYNNAKTHLEWINFYKDDCKKLRSSIFDLREAIVNEDKSKIEIAKKMYFLQIEGDKAFWMGVRSEAKEYGGLIAQMNKSNPPESNSSSSIEEVVDNIDYINNAKISSGSYTCYIHDWSWDSGVECCLICGIRK